MKRQTFIKTAAAAGAAAAAPVATRTSARAQMRSSTGGTITLLATPNFSPSGDDVFRDELKRWSAAHPGWTATLETISGNDLQAKTSASVQSGSGPDIIQMQYNWPWLYPQACVDVSDVADRVQRKQGLFYDNIAQQVRVHGRYLGIPWTYNATAHHYRKDIFDKIGVTKFPETFEEYTGVAKKLAAAKELPIGQAVGHAYGDANTFWYGVLWSFGGKEVEKDGKTVAINSPDTLKSLQWAIDFWYSGGVDQSGLSWDDSSNNRAYLSKTISETQNGASIYRVAQQKDPELAKLTYIAPPLRGPKAHALIQLTFGHSVMKWAKDPAACKDLIEFLMQKQNYGPWLTAAGLGAYPGTACDDLAMWKDPKMLVFNESVKLGRWPGWPGPANKASSEAETRYIVVDMYARAIQSKDAKGAMLATEKALQQIYGRS